MICGKSNIYSKDNRDYLCVIIFATICALFYALVTSIFTPNTYSFDAAIFMHIGQAMKDDYVPYMDIYDIKGPMLWLIEYIGQMVHDGRAGIFLLQIINLSAIAVISYKAARYYLTQLKAAFCVMISIAFLTGTCRLSSAVEEFTYLYSILAVCIILKNVHEDKGFLKNEISLYMERRCVQC